MFNTKFLTKIFQFTNFFKLKKILKKHFEEKGFLTNFFIIEPNSTSKIFPLKFANIRSCKVVCCMLVFYCSFLL